MLSTVLGFPSDRPLTDEERRVVVRSIVALGVPLALITLLVSVALVFYARHLSNDRIKDVKELTLQINRERLSRAREINNFIYMQCIEDEVRDVVVVELVRAGMAQIRATLPPGKVRTDLLESFQAGIDALEPDDEPDCKPPPVR